MDMPTTMAAVRRVKTPNTLVLLFTFSMLRRKKLPVRVTLFLRLCGRVRSADIAACVATYGYWLAARRLLVRTNPSVDVGQRV